MKFPTAPDARFARDQLITGCETMKHHLAALARADGKATRGIHTVRKFGKSLRGGFSLFGLKHSAAVEIQSIGRILAQSRDAASHLTAWKKLAWNDDPEIARTISSLLEQQKQAATIPPPPEVIAWCSARVATAESEIRQIPEDALTKRAKSGIKRLAGKITTCCATLDRNHPESFHEARKALKAWTGAISLFPHGRINPDPHLDDLLVTLGRENDLRTLAEWLRKHGFTPHFSPSLWTALSKKQRKIQKHLCKRLQTLKIT
ncbi:MAG: CHAD domain-containing protein [Verrucomicrobiales bacterium]|nr:CHAD domain-containing protein [Verrucomicrobiota bacterium JB025]